MSDRDKYVESLAADLYAAAVQWFVRIDPYYRIPPRWHSLRDDLRQPYRDVAMGIIEGDASRYVKERP